MGIKHLLNPLLFQGYREKNNYFEGWYYKFVSSDGKYAVAFIPGISLAGEKTHSFIQVFISQKEPAGSLKTSYFRFEKADFSYRDEPFSVTIGTHTFTGQSVTVDLRDKNLGLNGHIMIECLRPIEKGSHTPIIMGPFGYLPFMECYHGIVSMTSSFSGSLEIDGKPVSFDGGKGYIEKDWGRSFPNSYVWIQSNHFEDPNTSVMFS